MKYLAMFLIVAIVCYVIIRDIVISRRVHQGQWVYLKKDPRVQWYVWQVEGKRVRITHGAGTDSDGIWVDMHALKHTRW